MVKVAEKRVENMAQKQGYFVIEPYTRAAYLVPSRTREGIVHLVDLEGYEREKQVCTCESFIYGGARPCRHIRDVNMLV